MAKAGTGNNMPVITVYSNKNMQIYFQGDKEAINKNK
jgi:hypothetical protein